jgi:secretion/DNA translocation related TadE-like protein
VGRERGGATVWLAGFFGLVMLAAAVGLVSGTAVLARHRVEAAADLAALAGAVRAAAGEADACVMAGRIAAGNGGSLTRCVRAGDDVEVTVSARVDVGGLGAFAVAARARAGPVDRASGSA